MHQNAFGGQALPGPAEGAYSAPQTSNWIKGEGSGKGEGGEGEGRVRGKKEREGPPMSEVR